MTSWRRFCLLGLMSAALLSAGCTETAPPPTATPPTVSTATPEAPAAPPSNSADNADQRTGVSATEIVIGSCAALTGPSSFLGTQTLIGARCYINYINDSGGIFNRKIKLLSNDDCYDPDKAIECFNALLNSKIFAAAFFVGTPTAAKHVPMAEAHKIPLVGLFTGAQLLQEPFRPHVISVRASYFDEAREQIDNLWKAGVTRVAVIYQDDAFGSAVLEGVKRAMKTHNSEPVATGSFPRNATTFDTAIAQVRPAQPQAVILVGSYSPVAGIVKKAKSDRWTPLFSTVSFVGTEKFIEEAGPAADGTIITQVVPPPTEVGLKTVALYNKLLKKYFPDEKASFTSLEGFVDAMVLVEGLKRAGKDLTRDGFISAIESIHDFDLGLGPALHANYSNTNHKGLSTVFPTIIRDGKPVPLTDWKSAIPATGGK